MRRCVSRAFFPTQRSAAATSAATAWRACYQSTSSESGNTATPHPPSSSGAKSLSQGSAAAKSSSFTPGADASGTPRPEEFIKKQTAQDTMDLAAGARRDIYDLWRSTAESDEAAAPLSPGAEEKATAERVAKVAAILEKYRIGPTVPRDEDVCRGLGDALDRLLLLCLPLEKGDTDHLEKVLQASGRQGRQLSIRTVQHMFARTGSYVEALTLFYTLRRCNVAMNMEAYHAMLYSLQRLEEEGWAQRFHEEYVESKGEVITEQALDFVLRGVDNQLLPENKPWLGRIMFAQSNNAATSQQSRESFDSMGALWMQRYKSGGLSPE